MVLHITSSTRPDLGQWHYWVTDHRAISGAIAKFNKWGFDYCASTPFNSKENWEVTFQSRAPLVGDNIVFLKPHCRTADPLISENWMRQQPRVDAPVVALPFVMPGRKQTNIPPPPPPGHCGPFLPPPPQKQTTLDLMAASAPTPAPTLAPAPVLPPMTANLPPPHTPFVGQGSATSPRHIPSPPPSQHIGFGMQQQQHRGGRGVLGGCSGHPRSSWL